MEKTIRSKQQKPKAASYQLNNWYGAKCIFLHKDLKGKNNTRYVYKERNIVIKAKNDDDAIKKAELEANSYVKNEKQTVEYLGFVNVFNIFSHEIQNKTEVYSLMRSSNYKPDKYLDKFFDTGNEYSRK